MLLSKKIPLISQADLHKRYEALASELKLNPNGKLPSTDSSYRIATGAQLLAVALDDPDYGMDQDLPESFDPREDRPYMGGKTGFRSQGFRHMSFAGWKLTHPISTFQIPTHELGQAPERASLLAQFARSLLRKGDLAWGLRILGWSAHYIQDLAQPFHAVQIPNLRMVPWGSLFNLVPETTRTITNFHFAYERYVEHELARGVKSNFYACLSGTDHLEGNANPIFLAERNAEGSRKLGSEVGSALMGVYGQLKNSEFDLGNKKGELDYDRYLEGSNLQTAPERLKLDEVTCKALAHAIDSSALLIHWALQP